MIPNRNYNNPSQTYPPALMYGQPSQQSNQHNNIHNNLNQQQQQQHMQQQQQHQQQQQQAQGQQQSQGQAQSTNGDAGSNGAASAAPEMNLASVLHYLQSEWRRWERDRNEWEIERAEMRARIALLEGQRRSAENLKVDLLRRAKMLEYALRQARTNSQGTTRASGIAPAKLAALQEEDKAGKEDKEGSGSEGSEEGERKGVGNVPNGVHPAAMSKISFNTSKGDTSVWKNTGVISRDPKSRARSREYLKQCIQEISYLTSPGALNPLPARPLISNLEQTSPQPEVNGLPSTGSQEALQSLRPMKAMPERTIPSMFVKPEPEIPNEASTAEATTPPPPSTSQETEMDPNAKPPSSPAPRKLDLPEEPEDPSKQVLTAIYRPDSKAAWRKELAAAGEQLSRGDISAGVPAPPIKTDEEQLSSEEEEKPDKVWTSRQSLRSHLDVVRCLSFSGESSKLVLASGGDDLTVKVWSVDPSLVLKPKSNGTITPIEPIMTYRGHSEPITCVTISDPLKMIISGSLDSTIRCWKLPPTTQDPYSTYDASTSIGTLVGHTDAVWDLLLVKSPDKQQHVLVSASADGSIKIWSWNGRSSQGDQDHDQGEWTLSATFNQFGPGEEKVDVRPTCLGGSEDLETVIVGLSDGRVALYSYRTLTISKFIAMGGGSQINAVLEHSTSSCIITAHEDGYIRIYDPNNTHTPITQILAHPSPLNSLSLSPLSHLGILTSSTDCTIRSWDLTKKTCVQELGGHRDRSGEGVTMVKGHSELPVFASAGSDGALRLWGAG